MYGNMVCLSYSTFLFPVSLLVFSVASSSPALPYFTVRYSCRTAIFCTDELGVCIHWICVDMWTCLRYCILDLLERLRRRRPMLVTYNITCDTKT
ncbi:hypothetical protein BJV78DRAFT_1172537 [Lactifluus subvellereus]|nr:hypothetical protein BJV78DRAFT_1172537 [Lactifluus subvellereus]